MEENLSIQTSGISNLKNQISGLKSELPNILQKEIKANVVALSSTLDKHEKAINQITITTTASQQKISADIQVKI